MEGFCGFIATIRTGPSILPRAVQLEVLQLWICYGQAMRSCRPPLFRKRKFEPTVIVTCVRWYLRFSLSLRDVEELMAERGLSVDHTSIWRWTQSYGPEVFRRLRGAVDSHGETVDFYLSETRDREAAKIFLRKALANPDNRPPHVVCRDGLRSYPAAIRDLRAEGQVGAIAGSERAATAIIGSNPIIVTSNAACERYKDHGPAARRGW